MAEAMEDIDLGTPESYPNTLVSKMRMNMFDRYPVNLLLLRLRDRLSTAPEYSRSIRHLRSECKVHEFVGRRGLLF